MTERFDAIVIGTGQAGPSLAVRLATAGRKTAIIERKLIGGTCVNNGCIPTKTLIASARAAYVGMQPLLTQVPPMSLHSDQDADRQRESRLRRAPRRRLRCDDRCADPRRYGG